MTKSLRIKASNCDVYSIIDAEDYDDLSIHKWNFDGRYFKRYFSLPKNPITGKYPNKKVYIHREIMGFPYGLQVDHINGDKLDNRKANLRICTNAENNRNKPKRRGCVSRFKGVILMPYNRWSASISWNNKRVHIGYFDTEEEAALAYNDAAEKYFGDFAFLNEVKYVQ